MNIFMTGIDIDRAAIHDREVFSFTKSNAQRAVKEALRLSEADGCILISTCNRTELWLSGHPILSPYLTLCKLKGVNPDHFQRFFQDRSGEQAVRHLFALSCGLKSQVFGEDQIISQVKSAVLLSRECGCTGTVLEKLFQAAVTASKRVKSEIPLSSSHPCIASSAILLLKQKLGSLSGRPCLVIGSGEMGKQTARMLLKQGCQVSITQRRLHSEPADLPKGCRVIPYDQRLWELSRVHAVISATLSPHYTLKKNEVLPHLPQNPCLFVDLAVPRDIDPAIGQLPLMECYDLDSFDHSPAQEQKEWQLTKAGAILQEYEDQFFRWYHFRDFLPMVESIASGAAKETSLRMTRTIRRLPLTSREQATLERQIEGAAKKSISKLLFSLRDQLEVSQWDACFFALLGTSQTTSYPISPISLDGGASSYFPLFTSLQGKTVRIMGGGTIGLRRVRVLLPFGCRIEVIAPKALPELTELTADMQISWTQRCFQPGDCMGADLICACTNDRQANHLIAEECRRYRVPVSVADCKEECTFLFPAVVSEHGITVGVSSGGSDHRFVRRVTQRIRDLKHLIFSTEGRSSHETDH